MIAAGPDRAAAASDAPERAGSIRLLLSVDTEEDQWGPGSRTHSCKNIQRIPRLQEVLQRLGVRPTYFTSYQVAAEPSAAAILREVGQEEGVELAAHLHPWNTPPFCDLTAARHSMLNNLPGSVQREKLGVLTATLEDAFELRPRSFRGGRLGLGSETIDALIRSGYEIDSSVTPFMDWHHLDEGPNFVGAPMVPYRLGVGGDVRIPRPGGDLMEIPISVGYTRRPFALWDRVYRSAESIRLGGHALCGVLSRPGIVRKVILNPELETVPDLILAARTLVQQDVVHLHMFLHSSSLLPGCSPFTRSEADVQRLLHSIERFVEELRESVEVTFATVQELGRCAREGDLA